MRAGPGLDTLVRHEFLESMVDRAAAGQTVLLSSHQIGEVERVADIVAIVREGHLVLVERLDELKKQVRELTFTLTNGAPPRLDVTGEILIQRQRARQCQLLVRGVAEEELSRLAAQSEICGLETRVPNLEEIFVAYLQRSPADNGRRPAEVPST